MKRELRWIAGAGCALLLAGLIGCQSTQPRPAAMGMVNSKCPIKPYCKRGVQQASTVQWNGQTVGFCCNGCIDEWNQLSDADKAAKLAAAK